MDDLELALIWASDNGMYGNAAFISRKTGRIYYQGELADMDEEELPDDIEDASIYVRVPNKRDLDLGRDLVFDFVEQRAPALMDSVSEYFRRKGAYGRFKELLERKNLLDDWHQFENEATVAALRDWCAENGLTVEP